MNQHADLVELRFKKKYIEVVQPTEINTKEDKDVFIANKPVEMNIAIVSVQGYGAENSEETFRFGVVHKSAQNEHHFKSRFFRVNELEEVYTGHYATFEQVQEQTGLDFSSTYEAVYGQKPSPDEAFFVDGISEKALGVFKKSIQYAVDRRWSDMRMQVFANSVLIITEKTLSKPLTRNAKNKLNNGD